MQEFSKKYFELLTGEYAGINLTRIVDYEEFWIKQIQDSIEPYKQSIIFSDAIKNAKLHLDIGFGGGFPILPLAKLLPEIQFCGIETRAKKVKVVAEIAKKLNISNANFIHSRIENILIDKEVSISLKAVGKVNDFLEKIHSTEKVRVFFYKGPNFYDLEQQQLQQALAEWDLIEEREINLEGVEKRYLIGFENKKVLRGTQNKISKNLVKLSDLL